VTLAYDTLDAAGAKAVAEELVALYAVEYAGNGRPFDAAENFRRWLARDLTRRGYALVTARLGPELAGFVYGYRLPPDTGWWAGSLTPLPTEFTRETGDRTLAVGELIVRPDLRGRGIASRLHAELIRGRPERRGVLLVYPDNTVAKLVYESWGWRRFGQIRPSERAPVFDAYVLEPLAAVGAL